MKLKNYVIFMEDIYKYNNKIYTETILKETHLLINKGESNNIIEKIICNYPQIISERINEFVIRNYFQIYIYYGYAITAHKSQ